MAESFQIYNLPDPTSVVLRVDAALMSLAETYSRPLARPSTSGQRMFKGYLYDIQETHPSGGTLVINGVFRALVDTRYYDIFTDLGGGSYEVNPAYMTFVDAITGDFSTLETKILPPIGIKLKELKGVNTSRIPVLFADYVLSSFSPGPPGFTTLYFVPPISDASRLSPTPYRSYPTNEEYPWPDVLIDIDFKNNGFDGYTSSRKMRTGATLDSPVLVELFQGDHLPFPDSFLEHTEPCPREIYWNILADSGRLKCLHKKVTVPGYALGTTGITYKATNFEDWGEFVIRCRQEFIDGAYHVRRETIRPAFLPELIDI